ncbi:MAG: hypothetical protein JSS63_09900 [Bacteroidetes bacterium]|nr:hypothetical protein [Bacteroidota bacterium]
MKINLIPKIIHALLTLFSFSISGCMSSSHTTTEKVSSDDDIVYSYYYIERPELLMNPSLPQNGVNFFDQERWEYWGIISIDNTSGLQGQNKAAIYFDKKSLMASNNGNVLRCWVCFGHGGITMSLVVLNMYTETFEYLYSTSDEDRYDPNFFEKSAITANPENNILNTDPKQKFVPDSTEEFIYKKIIHYYFEHK